MCIHIKRNIKIFYKKLLHKFSDWAVTVYGIYIYIYIYKYIYICIYIYIYIYIYIDI